MKNIPFCGVTSDLDKCFDRIIREIVIPLAIRYGLPKSVANTYLAYMNKKHIHNVYAMGLGTPKKRTSSLPQGCSFSMRFLALVLTPWSAALKAAGAIPRAYADDLTIFVQGRLALIKLKRSLLYTNEYITHIGGIASVGKTWAWASFKDARTAIQKVWFPHDPEARVQVKLEGSDLGGHLDTSNRRTGTTTTKRCKAAAQHAKKVAHIPGLSGINTTLPCANSYQQPCMPVLHPEFHTRQLGR